jgi:hypothetical protein
MAVTDDLDKVASLCRSGARRALDALLDLGPRPDEPVAALLWEQQATRLQGQINSLSALVSKLTATAIVQGLREFEDELEDIGRVTETAEERIKEIREVSDLLTTLAKVLDLGTALLAAAAAPSPGTITALVGAGKTVRDSV